MSEISSPKASKASASKAASSVEANVSKTMTETADAAEVIGNGSASEETLTSAEKATRPMADAFDQIAKAQADFAQKMGFDPKTFAFDTSKLGFNPAKFGFDPSKFAFDPAKFGMDASAFGGNMPKFDVLFTQQQKNVETFFKAQAALVDGVQTVYQRQVALFQQSISEATTLLQSLMAEKDRKAGVEKQVDASKKAFEKMIAEAKELGNVVSKSQTEAFQLLNDRAVEQVEEIKAAYEKVA